MLIVGLGNPDRRYADTRHNVGFDLVDVLASRWNARRMASPGSFDLMEARLAGRELYLMKPMTYMNRSGAPVGRFLDEQGDGPDQCLVAVDDMALDVGRLRFRRRGSDGGHQGLASIERRLGSEEYPRLRIGVGPAPPSCEWADFVLSRFTSDERKIIGETLERAADGVERMLHDGIDKAMSLYNVQE